MAYGASAARALSVRRPIVILAEDCAASELTDDSFHAIRGDGETDAIGGNPGRRLYRREGWNADKLPLQIDQRPAAVAGVDRRARLNHARDGESPAIHHLCRLTIERADNAGGGRLFETQRAAHRKGKLADLHLAGITNGDWFEITCIDLQYRQVFVGPFSYEAS